MEGVLGAGLFLAKACGRLSSIGTPSISGGNCGLRFPVGFSKSLCLSDTNGRPGLSFDKSARAETIGIGPVLSLADGLANCLPLSACFDTSGETFLMAESSGGFRCINFLVCGTGFATLLPSVVIVRATGVLMLPIRGCLLDLGPDARLRRRGDGDLEPEDDLLYELEYELPDDDLLDDE